MKETLAQNRTVDVCSPFYPHGRGTFCQFFLQSDYLVVALKHCKYYNVRMQGD